MEDLSANSAANPDEFLNNDSVSGVSSATSVDETETQGAGEIRDGSALEENGSQSSNMKTSDQIMDSKLVEEHSPPVVEASGDKVLNEQIETTKCRKVNSQDEVMHESTTAEIDNDSGTEEDTTQGYLQLSENSGSTFEVSAANEDLNTNLSDRGDISGQGTGDVGETSETGATSERAMHMGEDSELTELAAGNKEKTGTGSVTEAEQQVLESIYHIKWIKWKGINTPIITQNENGPCPLLAIVNVLLLQRRINLPSHQEIVTSGQLMEYVGDCILEESPKVCSIS